MPSDRKVRLMLIPMRTPNKFAQPMRSLKRAITNMMKLTPNMLKKKPLMKFSMRLSLSVL